jgi:hypothetical protein
MRVAEVDLDAGIDAEPDVVGEFLATVPGERSGEVLSAGAGFVR